MTRAVWHWLAEAQFLVKKEFPTAVGVCDLVACRADRSRVEHRFRQGQRRKLGSLLQVDVWSRLPDPGRHRSITLEDLAESYCGKMPTESLRDELARLVAHRFAHVTKTGRYKKLHAWSRWHTELIAIELKLSRFSDAIKQASRYQSFADTTYVAFPASVADKLATKNRAELEDWGIGLLGVLPDRVDVLVNPSPHIRRHAVDLVAQTHAVERFWPDLQTAQH